MMRGDSELNEVGYDPVDRPSHYQLFPGEESLDLIKKMLPGTEYVGFLKGNVLKYRFRAGKKGPVQEDIDKALKYEELLREYLNG